MTTGEAANATGLPKPGVYRHFKGAEYELLSVARHSESEELLAVYRSVDHPEDLWVRPIEMFTEVVDLPRGAEPRFAFQASLSGALVSVGPPSSRRRPAITGLRSRSRWPKQLERLATLAQRKSQHRKRTASVSA